MHMPGVIETKKNVGMNSVISASDMFLSII